MFSIFYGQSINLGKTKLVSFAVPIRVMAWRDDLNYCCKGDYKLVEENDWEKF